MPRYLGQPEFDHASAPRVGVLLVNLGTPAAPTPAAVRRYLAEFLWDPRVVEVPRPVWWLILNAFILPFRAPKSAHAYAQIWTAEGSPLLTVSRRQAQALADALAARHGDAVRVDLAMRYGKPSIPEALSRLGAANCERLIVLPLYPQYSGSTTGSVFDGVAMALTGMRRIPDLRFVASYHDDAPHISALAASVREHWVANGRAERLLMSFHGVPMRYLLDGDPYHCHCHKTARLLAEALELPADAWQIGFQSRLGRAEWLRPYTDETLVSWAKAGLRSVDVVCPGFAADCLETLEEICIRGRESFVAAGGERLAYVPCLNDRADHIAALAALVERQLAGWPQGEPGYDHAGATRLRAASAGRARALGAEK